MTTVANYLSFIRAGIAYLNANSHTVGVKKALAAAGVCDLPGNSRNDAIRAALAAYPERSDVLHDESLKAAVIAAAEAWTA